MYDPTELELTIEATAISETKPTVQKLILNVYSSYLPTGILGLTPPPVDQFT